VDDFKLGVEAISNCGYNINDVIILTLDRGRVKPKPAPIRFGQNIFEILSWMMWKFFPLMLVLC
jgi:hypothetical protein